MNENFAEQVAKLLDMSVADVLNKMSFALRDSDSQDHKAVANNFSKDVIVAAEKLEKQNFVAWMAANYPNVDCSIRKDNEFWSNTPDPMYLGWLGRVAFGGLILNDQMLLDYQRRLFEEDATKRGFDVTRTVGKVALPFDEYMSDETGHRWGGWLTRSFNG